MRTIEIKEISKKSDLNKLVNLPWELYKNDSTWVPPLKLAVKDLFDPKHPFFKTGKIKSWLAIENGETVGRIVAIVNDAYNKFQEDKTGFFGFYESTDDEDVAKALFEQAESWLKSEGMEKVMGPMNPSTNYECGTLVEGFDDPPQIMMTYNPRYHKGLIEGQGYTKAKDLIAYVGPMDVKLPEIILKIAARAEKKEKITFRHANKKDWANEVDRMLEIYNDAWEKNWGFVPMTDEEFRHTAKDLKSVIDERLIIFAEVKGEPAGFIVGLPDLNQVFKKIPTGKLLPTGIFKILNFKKHVTRMRVPTLGVKAKFQKYGLASMLYLRCRDEGLKAGYKEWEASWILEDNTNMNKPLIRMGAKPYKTYRIFEKSL